jgi:hypothetical protein
LPTLLIALFTLELLHLAPRGLVALSRLRAERIYSRVSIRLR